MSKFGVRFAKLPNITPLHMGTSAETKQVFIGVDLAWKDSNPSGFCVLESSGIGSLYLRSLHLVTSVEDLFTNIMHVCTESGNVAVGIDAPLVLNQGQPRPAERTLASLYSPYKLAAYPASDKSLRQFQYGGTFIGSYLAERLAERGFAHPTPTYGLSSLAMAEVYPHTTLIYLQRQVSAAPQPRLKYKLKKGVSVDDRKDAFRQILELLKLPITPEFSLEWAGTEWFQGLQMEMEQATTHAQLKPIEDKLDSILCALTMVLARHLTEVCVGLGTVDAGYILAPMTIGDFARLEQKRTTYWFRISG
jgi:predicted RNase H-like nuclease